MTAAPIRLLIVEDQALVLGAIAALLNLEADIEVVATATTAEEGLQLLGEQQVDMLLTDIELPLKSGIELSEQVSALYPNLGIIILTTFARPGYLERAIKAGARGYLLKDSPAQTLADNIRKVHAGRRIIDSELVARAWSDGDPLTDRQRQCLRLAGDGLSTADIAAAVHLSEGTVRNYLSEAIGKLNARNRIEAARVARQKGWL